MTDIVDQSTRSRMMSGIKGKNTKPELSVRSFLHSHGFRYSLHDTKLPGKPDIVLRKYKMVILVHGCFWHRHLACKLASCPVQNREKWQLKFIQNVERDRKQIAELLDRGWRVTVIWECGLRLAQTNLSWLEEHLKQGKDQFLEWPKYDDLSVSTSTANSI